MKMPDPLTLGVLGGLAATEGIKFLFNQASEVLRAWRERQANKALGEQASDELQVPVHASEALDAAPTSQSVDLRVLEQENKSLRDLIGRVAPYAQDLADIEVDDVELADAAGRLRAILEALYGQRFTFRGEDRDPTGVRVNVHQVLGEVAGRAVATEADITAGHLEVEQHVQTVKEGGAVIGYKGKIG